MVRIAVVVALVLGAACKKSGTPGGGGEAGGKIDERQACTVDKDCVAIDVACCDHCNGGKAAGVHRDFAAEAQKEYRNAPACKQTACTKMACDPAVPICRQGRCGVMVGGEEDLSALPRP